ncbi:MAG: RNA-binding protein [Candidatus Azotimanducaceae bacterium]|jgi:RNA-binding protein
MLSFKATSELSTRMNLTKVQNKRLRAESHQLKPVVMIGQNGLTEAVQNEIEIAIEHHELIKIRIPASEKSVKKQMIDAICARHKAEPVQAIGNIAVIYRRNVKADLPAKIASPALKSKPTRSRR